MKKYSKTKRKSLSKLSITAKCYHIRVDFESINKLHCTVFSEFVHLQLHVYPSSRQRYDKSVSIYTTSVYLGMNTCTFEQNRGIMPAIKGLLKTRLHEIVRLQNRDLSWISGMYDLLRLLRTSLRDFQRPLVTVISKKYILWLVMIKKSERSCDPAHEFIIFIAKARSESLSFRTCIYSLPKLTLDWLIFAKIFVIFVRFRGVLRPWSRFYREYEDNVKSLMQMVW